MPLRSEFTETLNIWTRWAWKTVWNCGTGRSGNRSARKIFYYAGLALIPVVILLVMFLVAHRR